MMATDRDTRSVGDLLAELSRETGHLVRAEIELARTEMALKAKAAARSAGMMAVGGVLAHAGLLVLLATVVIALAQFGMAPWLAALMVAVLTMVVGALLLWRGAATMRTTSLAPKQTLESLKETASWTTR